MTMPTIAPVLSPEWEVDEDGEEVEFALEEGGMVPSAGIDWPGTSM